MKAEAVNQLVVGSSPTGGATAKPATLLAFPEEFEAILIGDVFEADFKEECSRISLIPKGMLVGH